MKAKHAIDSSKPRRAVANRKRRQHDEAMGSIIIRDVDENLRKKFRLLCIENNTSMNQVIKDYIRRVVEMGKLK